MLRMRGWPGLFKTFPNNPEQLMLMMRGWLGFGKLAAKPLEQKMLMMRAWSVKTLRTNIWEQTMLMMRWLAWSMKTLQQAWST